MVIDPTTPTRDINRRLLFSIHQDGLMDILAGLIVLTFGLIPILDESGLNPGLRQVIFLTFYGLEVGTVIWLKHRITRPRTGLVVLSSRMRNRLSLILLGVNVLIFLVFAGAYIFDVPIWEYFGSYQLSVPLGLIFLIIFTVSGSLLKAPRFSYYGIGVMLGFIVGEHLFLKGLAPNHGIPLAGITLGSLIVASGVLQLIRFMRIYKLDNQ